MTFFFTFYPDISEEFALESCFCPTSWSFITRGRSTSTQQPLYPTADFSRSQCSIPFLLHVSFSHGRRRFTVHIRFNIAPERALPSFDAPQVNLRNLGIFLIFILKYVFIGERGLIVTRIGHFPDWNAWVLMAEEWLSADTKSQSAQWLNFTE